MTTAGSLLAEHDDHTPPTSTVFLRSVNGDGVQLLPTSSAEALLKHVTALPLLTITRDLNKGFAWSTPGAVPPRSQTVIPLAAPPWPQGHRWATVFIELWWPPDETGYHRVRSFLGYAGDPFQAYLIACCLWSTPGTGGGARWAFLYGPDRRTAYRINEVALTCSQVPDEDLLRFRATAAERDTTDPLPDAWEGAAPCVKSASTES